MKIRPYRNGDRYPCCGQEIRGKSPEFLESFNRAVAILGLPFPPEDAAGPYDTFARIWGETLGDGS